MIILGKFSGATTLTKPASAFCEDKQPWAQLGATESRQQFFIEAII